MIWSIARAILTFTIPVPVALLVAGIGAYKVAAWYDKTKAIDAAIAELVAGAELEAERARAAAAQKRAEEAQKLTNLSQAQARAAERALAEFYEQAKETEQQLKDEIDDILSTPIPDNPTPDFLRRLRNQRGPR